MSESSTDKTKRKVIAAMETYQPAYQTTFVFDEDMEPEYTLEAFTKIRKKVLGQFPQITLIWWIRVYRYNGQMVPMFQLFSTDKLDKVKLNNAIERTKIKIELHYNQRSWTEENRVRWCSTIRKHKLHNLPAVYGKEKIRRFAINNKSANRQ
ncbi:hypothetical protein [Shewanella sp. ALD9]|uniref:hypothetical protein n=1 Tax=Shewanella sp. ALD9 TaxID=2058330 RepID=UPI000C34BE8D|nr:hypothetical protein [Shewanella sp. ALD9]PKH31496.1 hypothetical protein CXF88_13195 [Shewanella sp. ALD9]